MRPIDADDLERKLSSLARLAKSDAQKSLLGRALYIVGTAPALTPQNEPLSCEGCYWDSAGRPFGRCGVCVREKTDNYRRPPEGEEDA